MYLKQLKLPNGFKTFIINSYKKGWLTTTQVYGVNIEKCEGNSILDGLKYINTHYNNTLLQNLQLPKCSDFSNSYCLNCIMNINGRNLPACDTPMKEINEIYPISPKPLTTYAAAALEGDIEYTISDIEYTISKRFCM